MIEADAKISEQNTINNIILREMTQASNECHSTVLNVSKMIYSWQHSSLYNEIPYSNLCSENERSIIAQEINDLGQNRGASILSAQDYSLQAERTVENLASYAIIRAKYDAEYVKNKTRHLQNEILSAVNPLEETLVSNINFAFGSLYQNIDVFTSCISMRPEGDHLECYENLKSARQQIEDILLSYRNQMVQAMSIIGEFSGTTQTYLANVNIAFANVQSFFNGITSVIESAGLNTNSFGSWWYLNLNDFYPDPVNWPDISYFSLPDADLDDVWDSVSMAFDDLVANISIASLLTTDYAQDWADTLNILIGEIDFTPADYNPPLYNATTGEINDFDGETEYFKNSSSLFLDQMNLIMMDETITESSESMSQIGDSYNISMLLSSGSSQYVSNIDFPIEPFSTSGIDIPVVFDLFGMFGSMLLFMDLFFRIYSSLQMCRKYWSRTSTNIKDADLRIDKHFDDLDNMGSIGIVSATLTSPILPVVILVFFLIFAVIFTSEVYLPILNDYQDVCVKQGNDGGNEISGTFLTKNLFALAMNYASQDGNEHLASSHENYNMNRIARCSELEEESKRLFVEVAQPFNIAKQSHEYYSSLVPLLSKCIDVEQLDQKMTDTMWEDGYSAASFTTVGQMLSESKCSNDTAGFRKLETNLFQCSDLPEFTLTCGQQHRFLLGNVTHDCGCTIEWKMHAGWLQMAIATAVYGLINLSRVLLTSGMVGIYWKHLNPGIFTFKATCSRDGNFLLPWSSKKKNVHEFQSVLKNDLDSILKMHELMGFVRVFLAIIVNIPWIYFLSSISQNVEPNF